MPRFRAASPAGSEADFDIADQLLDRSGSDSDNDYTPAPLLKPSQRTLDAEDILEGFEESDDDEAFIAAQQAASNRKTSNLKTKTAKSKSGGFQAMGLNETLLRAIIKKGFNVPTPIQRKAIPLLLDGQDVVGMARTGSGKTAAFVIPMIEKLKTHSVKVGARALIFSPSRELALQTLKVVREFGKGTDLKSVLLVGGDSLEEQFSAVASNPDIIIATPGRFLHLKVEMQLDLRSMQYVVFDEADRLFEMGFASQLTEILYSLPSTRQTLLFSATLPKSLVEFAKAGLQDPSLVRLDADAKISQELESAFFNVKPSEKEAALLYLLQEVIRIPHGEEMTKEEAKGKKRKRLDYTPKGNQAEGNHSTIVFVATKHHVEYLANFIKGAGYAVSYVYGSLDQVARRNQVAKFRSGATKILVVTDVAARGIDIPVLSNVINYDFPPQPKIFVHRVGRTARAGKRGWSYSFVRNEDLPYLLDLQLFLGRKLVLGREPGKDKKSDYNFAQDVVVGTFQRDILEENVEAAEKILSVDKELPILKDVARKGEKLYTKTKPAASSESAKRAKEVASQKGWTALNPIFVEDVNDMEDERVKMLARVSNFRPQETVFELGQRGVNASEAAEMMKRRRSKIIINHDRHKESDDEELLEGEKQSSGKPLDAAADSDDEERGDTVFTYESADEDDIENTFRNTIQPSKKAKTNKKKTPTSYEDSEFFLSYHPSTSLAEDRAYALNPSFSAAAQQNTLDLTNDDGKKGQFEASKVSGKRWDPKARKYVNKINDMDGSRAEPGKKGIIRGESGQKLPASFRSGRFDAWKKSHRISRLPRVGELESQPGSTGHQFMPGPNTGAAPGTEKRPGKLWHKEVKAPKLPDKFRDDYEVRKKRVAEAREKGILPGGPRNEIKDVDTIRKDRILKEKRREKTARPSKKGKGGGSGKSFPKGKASGKTGGGKFGKRK
ncbi:DEAD-domain-containing protein [Ascobolus immersus RN42]|uniref:RNA helicase n=1 Tax=Ascobolus immersus RN42 TaxID=1160509 RepID=A0A3N4IF20_ASCIM|nr:DEAD-domain-containing protein [Ascobolus immersus RN42]